MARDDLRAIYAYLSERSPQSADRVVGTILKAANGLTVFPLMGRQVEVEGTRERVVARYPYIIIYVLEEGTVVVARILGSYTLLMMAVGSLSAIYSETASHTHLRRPVSPVARLWGVLPANCLATRRSPERRQRPHHQKCV